jgi:hypothetical protein
MPSAFQDEELGGQPPGAKSSSGVSLFVLLAAQI